jgi:hypothetical protein
MYIHCLGHTVSKCTVLSLTNCDVHLIRILLTGPINSTDIIITVQRKVMESKA